MGISRQALRERIQQNKTTLRYVGYAVILILAVKALLFDFSHAESLPLDLRNRVVGARMLSDGLSPYFYIWKPGDTLRYYDPAKFNLPGNVSIPAVTSTPFLHGLMAPLVDMSQMQIDIAWFIAQYLSLIFCAWMVYKGLGNRFGFFIAFIIAFFAQTSGWHHHLFAGQNYIFISLFACVSFYFMSLKNSYVNAFFASLFVAAACLIKLDFILCFLPFLFVYKKYWKYGLCLGLILGLYVAYVFLSPLQMLNWQDYFKIVKLHSHIHLFENIDEVVNTKIYNFQFEGIEINLALDERLSARIMEGQENTAFYIIAQRLKWPTFSANQLLLMGTICMTLTSIPFLWIRIKRIQLQLPDMLILGFVMFYMFDFFIPIARYTYFWVLWLLPLLLYFVSAKRNFMYVIAIIGFTLNIVILPNIKMEHTIGQFLLIAAFLYHLYAPIFHQRKVQHVLIKA